MGGSSFTAGEESVTLDFANAEITKNDESIELSDLAEGDILTVEVGSSNTAASATVESVGGGQSFGGSGEVTQGTAATTISEDGTYSGESYTSTGDDENALRVDGAAVTLDGVTVDKSAGATSNTEDGDFYGMNAALLAMNGVTVTIKNATVTSSAQNGNGVFSYGSGTTVNISDSTITTTADNSGGDEREQLSCRDLRQLVRGHPLRPRRRYGQRERRRVHLERLQLPRGLLHSGHHREECEPDGEQLRSPCHRG